MLKPDDTVRLFKSAPERLVQAGDVIFKEGDQEICMYGIVEGKVEMHLNGKLIETLETGDVFGEGALLHADHRRSSTAIAKTDCILAPMDQEHFLFAVQQTPMFAVEVMRSYSDRFRHLKELIQAII
ncbi:MAG: cyclic nucleotide-binding domain-containing protein [Snowella sp.]|nr:cyclic nucleotide-binding domain-containing protein [Snowella sp.]